MFRILAKFLRDFISVRIHVALVFAPARIQEKIPGELFMFGNPPAWHRGLPGPKPQKSPKGCPGAGAPESPKSAPRSPKRVQKRSFGLFFRGALFGDSGAPGPGWGPKSSVSRHPGKIDNRQITYLICARLERLLYDFLGGFLGLLPVVFLYKRTNPPPLKKSYSKCLRRTQIG